MILTIDLGTTSIRCLAISSEGTCAAITQKEFTQHFPQPTWVEHDAQEIWKITQALLNSTLNKIKQIPTAIAITNQRETVVAWDKKTQSPLANAIVWQCRRTADRMKEFSKTEQNKIKKLTGLPCDAYFSASKMQWLLKNNSKVKQAAKENVLHFGTIDSWILFKLTNGKSFKTDTSNASRTMLMNLKTCQYDSELLNIFSIKEKWLPKICASNSHFGDHFISQTQHPIPIHAILGDQQASLFAQCGEHKTRVKNTYGTGLFICTTTETKPVFTPSLIATVAWTQNDITTYALEGSVFSGGSAIQWCRDELNLIPHAKESETLAEKLQHNDNVYFVPALTGLGAPHWDPHAGGMFIGLTRSTTKNHLVRAALESLAYQTKDVCEQFKEYKTIKELWVDGGATSNEFLMQFQANILNIPVIKTTVSESTAYGVAGLAAITLELITFNGFQNWFKLKKRYEPMFNKQTINQYYKQWTNALERSLKWH